MPDPQIETLNNQRCSLAEMTRENLLQARLHMPSHGSQADEATVTYIVPVTRKEENKRELWEFSLWQLSLHPGGDICSFCTKNNAISKY